LPIAQQYRAEYEVALIPTKCLEKDKSGDPHSPSNSQEPASVPSQEPVASVSSSHDDTEATTKEKVPMILELLSGIKDRSLPINPYGNGKNSYQQKKEITYK